MKLAQNKIVVILFMLVAFIGQAMASITVPCAHESMNTNMSMMTHEAMTNMDHAMMIDSAEQTADENTLMDCCQEQCKCPMNGCISLSLLVNVNLSFNYGVITQQKISQLLSLHQPQVNSSLYRPPIS